MAASKDPIILYSRMLLNAVRENYGEDVAKDVLDNLCKKLGIDFEGMFVESVLVHPGAPQRVFFNVRQYDVANRIATKRLLRSWASNTDGEILQHLNSLDMKRKQRPLLYLFEHIKGVKTTRQDQAIQKLITSFAKNGISIDVEFDPSDFS